MVHGDVTHLRVVFRLFYSVGPLVDTHKLYMVLPVWVGRALSPHNYKHIWKRKEIYGMNMH